MIIDPLGDYTTDGVAVESLEEWAAYVRAAPGRWRVVFSGPAAEALFEEVLAAVQRVGQVLVVVDEADWWAQPTGISPGLARALKYGRHHGVEVLAIARRPAEVHRLVTSQAYHVWAFATSEPVDLDYLRRYVSAEVAEQVADLPPYRAVYWDARARRASVVTVDNGEIVRVV